MLEATASGVLTESDVTVDMLANEAVTYAKIQDGVADNMVLKTTASGVLTETDVTVDMLANEAVTYAKIQDLSRKHTTEPTRPYYTT